MPGSRAVEAAVRNSGPIRRAWEKWLERFLVIVGVVCLGYYAHQTIEARNFQREQAAAFEAALSGDPRLASAVVDRSVESRPTTSSATSDTATTAAGPTPSARPASVAPGVTGRRTLPTDDQWKASKTTSVKHLGSNVMALLDIPRLKLSSAVISGDDAEVLDVAVGHLPDTPKPWEGGNSALAAHRDGLFRPLRRIRVGDELRVRSQHGEFMYRVRETKIVAPDDLSVLAPTDTPSLTLITCYPFNFIGSAPKRFIVHADRVDSALSTQ